MRTMKTDWLPKGAREALMKQQGQGISCPIPGSRQGAGIDLKTYTPGARRDAVVAFFRKQGMPADLVELAADAVAASPDAGDLLQSWTLSTKRVDSYEDTVDPDGWNLADFKRNPVVLFAHKADQLPVGRDMGVWIEPGAALKGVTRFASKDLHEFGDTVGRLVAAGILNATSVGFSPEEFEVSHRGEDSWMPGIDFKRQTLREYSVVPVPANMDALADGRSMGIDLSPIVSWAEQVLDGAGSLYVPRSMMESVRKAALCGAPISVRVADGIELVAAMAEQPATAAATEEAAEAAGAETPSSGSEGVTTPIDFTQSCTCPECAWTGPILEALFASTAPETIAVCPSCSFTGGYAAFGIGVEAAEVLEEPNIEPEKAAEDVSNVALEGDVLIEVGDRVVVIEGNELDPSHVGVGAIVEDVTENAVLLLFDGADSSVSYPLTSISAEEVQTEPEEKADVPPEGAIAGNAMCMCPLCGYEGVASDFSAAPAPTADPVVADGGDGEAKAGQNPAQMEDLAASVALIAVREIQRQITQRTGRLP